MADSAVDFPDGISMEMDVQQCAVVSAKENTSVLKLPVLPVQDTATSTAANMWKLLFMVCLNIAIQI